MSGVPVLMRSSAPFRCCVTDRPAITVPTPLGGWGPPWPNVAEIAAALPHESWTLVGGLMTQLHAATVGIDTVRPTDDVDIILHVDTTPAAPHLAATALESLGYTLAGAFDPRDNTAHRFRRGRQAVDLVTSEAGSDVVDVLAPDHASARSRKRLRGRDMVVATGGTQALQRTVTATMDITAGISTVVGVPSVLGALVLKAAAFTTDSRDPARHLTDASVLLACVQDPIATRAQLKGSDRSRLRLLSENLPDESSAWRRLDRDHARAAQAVLRILTVGP